MLLIAAMGERLTPPERRLFKQLTGRDQEPRKRVEEFVGVVGRRGGRSRAAISVLAAYISGLCEHPALVPGERGVLLIIAPDQKQATICLDYITAAFEASPILRQLIEGRTQGTLRLTNKVDIEVRAGYFRHLRGPTYIGVVCDEVAFFHSENSANPDTEILNAVKPGLATTRGPLFMISSPYARKGELWRTFKRHYGAEGDPLVLVAKGTSREFNSTLPQSVVDRAIERDEPAARAEYLAEFRKDIESFVSVEAVTACVSPGVYERSPQRNVRYHGFVDPSGGSSNLFTLAIGHVDFAKQTVIVDAVREVRPPFSPEITVVELAKILHTYHVGTIIGDRYAGEWPVEQFGKVGIKYEQSAKPKRDLYTDLLPLINSRRIELLDDTRLVQPACKSGTEDCERRARLHRPPSRCPR